MSAPAAAGAWSPFRFRTFSVLWGAALVSNIGSWMHDLAAGWLMTTLAPAPLMVALVQAATTMPVFLLALPAGTLADRVDKRRLLLVVQTAMLTLAAILGLLVLRGLVTQRLLLAVTFGLGACTAILSPVWQSILPRLVPREQLQPAVALQAVGVNISRAIGPALGGAIIVALGLAWPFFFNAASFIGVIAALLWWRSDGDPPRRTPAGGFMHAMFEGLRHVGSNRALRNALTRSALFYLFGSAYWALLPLIARVQLAGDARLFGVLVGFIGVGAVAGAVFLPRLRGRVGLDGVVNAGTIGTAVGDERLRAAARAGARHARKPARRRIVDRVAVLAELRGPARGVRRPAGTGHGALYVRVLRLPCVRQHSLGAGSPPTSALAARCCSRRAVRWRRCR